VTSPIISYTVREAGRTAYSTGLTPKQAIEDRRTARRTGNPRAEIYAEHEDGSTTGPHILDEDRTELPPDSVRLRSLIEAGGYTQRGAAQELQISERMMRYYCSGEQPVPRTILLALEHLVNCPQSNRTGK
jgi:hypothetical protein